MALPPLTPRCIDGITARKQDGVTGFFSKDLHGDVRYAFDSTGTEIANYVYDAWGDERTNDDAAWEINNPVRYNGQYLDEETGMYYLRARYYDPEVSRFISEDPIKDGLNWYAYAGNNPVMFVDPSGLFGRNTVLKYGASNNPDVVKVQQKLYESGYIDEKYITGNFYSITQEAVEKFQADNGLLNDGIVGQKTWGALGLDFDNDLEVTYYEAGGQKNIKAKAVYAEINGPNIVSVSPSLMSAEVAFSELEWSSANGTIAIDGDCLVMDGNISAKPSFNMALFKGTIKLQIDIPFINKQLEGELSGYMLGIGTNCRGYGKSGDVSIK